MKNCDRGLENAARGRRPKAAFSSPRSQFFTIRTDPKPVNNLFIFFSSLKRLCFYFRHTHASVTVTVVRDRKIRTALRTNQIAEFVTVTAWKKIIKLTNFSRGIVCKPGELTHRKFGTTSPQFSRKSDPNIFVERSRTGLNYGRSFCIR